MTWRQRHSRCGPRRSRWSWSGPGTWRHHAQSGQSPSRSRLYRRPRAGAKILGVCGGIADYAGINAGLVRPVWLVFLLMFPPPTLVTYLFLAWLLDVQPEDLFETKEEEAFWRSVRTDPSKTFAGLKHKFRTLELRLRGLEAHVTSPAFKMDQELNGGRGSGRA